MEQRLSGTGRDDLQELLPEKIPWAGKKKKKIPPKHHSHGTEFPRELLVGKGIFLGIGTLTTFLNLLLKYDGLQHYQWECWMDWLEFLLSGNWDPHPDLRGREKRWDRSGACGKQGPGSSTSFPESVPSG